MWSNFRSSLLDHSQAWVMTVLVENRLDSVNMIRIGFYEGFATSSSTSRAMPENAATRQYFVRVGKILVHQKWMLSFSRWNKYTCKGICINLWHGNSSFFNLKQNLSTSTKEIFKYLMLHLRRI